ncbi:MFS general substrate transporter [Lophiostoma macrostomum CBS 122681]|uniref:MFS general substrate transporter n=1 Tax=Lophiostoma macrostomum CBS 122681 TaxID=1314788 RepID=A0A6A6SLY4_9PLEO|nr:MFS general substrate transporter [Lophiostoma macrostomum CBS 122681]
MPEQPESSSLRTPEPAEVAQPCDSEPLQWPAWRKVTSVAVVSFADCLTFLVSMMLAPSIPQVLQEFRPDGSDKFLGSFSVTVYILGFVVGPLLFGPLTDLTGRTSILRFTATFYLIFTVACALSNSLSMLIAFRFIAGIFGGAPMAIGGGVVSDLYELSTAHVRWRGTPWAGLCVVSLFLLLEETHQATLVRRGTDDASTRSAYSMIRDWTAEKVGRTLRRSIKIPVLIVRYPPALAVLVLITIFNGLVNTILSSLGSVFQFQYGFSPAVTGLSYLGLGLGGAVGLAVTPYISDFFTGQRLHPDGIRGPQHTLPMMLIAGPLASIGFLWYGWSCQARSHWIIPILGLSVFGFGYMSMRLSTQIFLMQAVPDYTASALAAHTIFSSIGGAFIPIGTFPLYDRIGYGWGNSVIAFTNLILCVIPFGMYLASRKRGEEWIIHLEI